MTNLMNYGSDPHDITGRINDALILKRTRDREKAEAEAKELLRQKEALKAAAQDKVKEAHADYVSTKIAIDYTTRWPTRMFTWQMEELSERGTSAKELMDNNEWPPEGWTLPND